MERLKHDLRNLHRKISSPVHSLLRKPPPSSPTPSRTNVQSSSTSLSVPHDSTRHDSPSIAPSPLPPAELQIPITASTNYPPDGPAPNPPVNDGIQTAWHGVKQLLKRAEKLLDGTLAKPAVAALNTIIDIIDVGYPLRGPHTPDDQFLRQLEITGADFKKGSTEPPNGSKP